MAFLEALDKIFILFGEVALRSQQLALKFIEKDIKSNESSHCNNCVNVAKQFGENDILSHILTDGVIDTHSKRNTIAKNNFNYVEEKKLPLGKDLKSADCFIAYNSPADVLKRYFERKSIQYSFERFAEEFHNLKNQSHYYGDFFTSPLFEELQRTLSREEWIRCKGLPLIIGFYRLVLPF